MYSFRSSTEQNRTYFKVNMHKDQVVFGTLQKIGQFVTEQTNVVPGVDVYPEKYDKTFNKSVNINHIKL